MVEKDGFSEAAQERLARTPVTLEEWIQKLRGKAATNRYLSEVGLSTPISEEREQLATRAEGFLRMLSDAGIPTIEYHDQLRVILAAFIVKSARDEARIKLWDLLLDCYKEAQANRFERELPDKEFAAQVEKDRQRFAESEELEEEQPYEESDRTKTDVPPGAPIGKDYLLGGKEHIRDIQERYGVEKEEDEDRHAIDIGFIASRAKLLLHDLLRKYQK